MDCTLVPRCSVYWVSRSSFWGFSGVFIEVGARKTPAVFFSSEFAQLPAGIIPTSPQPPSLQYLRSHDVGELPIPTGARQLSRVLQVSVRTRVKPQFPECLGP